MSSPIIALPSNWEFVAKEQQIHAGKRTPQIIPERIMLTIGIIPVFFVQTCIGEKKEGMKGRVAKIDKEKRKRGTEV